MKSIDFPEVTQKIAEHQDEFQTVLVQFNEAERSVNMCWEFTEKEMKEFIKTKQLWYKQVIPRGQMHPMKISPFKHDIITHNPEIIEQKGK